MIFGTDKVIYSASDAECELRLILHMLCRATFLHLFIGRHEAD
jgi:hypothetical protein